MPAIGVRMRMSRTPPALAIVSVWVACTAMVDPGFSQPSGITYQRVRTRDTIVPSHPLTPERERNRDGDSPPRPVSACGARGGAGDRPDVREHAAGIPGWEGSYQRRRAVELDAARAGGLGPGELACVPFHEGFGFRCDVEVLVEAGVRLADLDVSELDEQPIALTARPAGEVEADDDASIREPVSAQRVAHRPQRHKGVEVFGSDTEPRR